MSDKVIGYNIVIAIEEIFEGGEVAADFLRSEIYRFGPDRGYIERVFYDTCEQASG
jgi:hypothetical protein